jgi:predicted lipoprotein with Yx(FWY)xxD motif
MNTTYRRTRRVAFGLAAITALAACGQPDPAPSAAPEAAATAAPAADPAAPAATAAPAVPAAAGAVVTKIAESPLGQHLVGSNGMTLYGFTNDVDAKSTCVGTCADQWPPVIVDPTFSVGPGVDAGIFATTVRDDGQQQLVAGKVPLYFYAGDVAPGDTTGQGSGGVWFVVSPAGSVITDAAAPAAPAEPAPAPEAAPAAPSIQLLETGLGAVITDAQGFTLYLFTKDAEGGVPTCVDGCATAWPPAIVTDPIVVGPGLDPALVSTVETINGLQLKIGKWPLYRYAGDTAPGETGGQGSGDVWFVVGPDAKSIR